MSQLERFVSELRDRKLLPVVALLLVAIVAVPVALSKTAATPPPAPAPGLGAAAPSAPSLPAVSVSTIVPTSRLTSRPHDPFVQGPPPKPNIGGGRANPVTTTSSTSAGSRHGAASTASGSGSGTAGGASGTGSGGGSGGATTTTTTTSIVKPVPHPIGPRGLARDHAYSLTLGLTDGGDVNTLDGVERLTPLPSASQPLLLPLGVLQGGNRVLFAVLPGAIVDGPGRCVPGPVDCEIVILSPGEIERVSRMTGFGPVLATQLAVTGIQTARFSSVAAAQRARRAVSARGADLLRQADLPAVALFPFDPARGALLDQRNLNGGGN